MLTKKSSETAITAAQKIKVFSKIAVQKVLKLNLQSISLKNTYKVIQFKMKFIIDICKGS